MADKLVIELPTDPEKLKALVKEINTICDEWLVIESHKAAIADIVANTADAMEITKPQVLALARMHYKRNRDEVEAKNDAVLTAYDTLFNQTN